MMHVSRAAPERGRASTNCLCLPFAGVDRSDRSIKIRTCPVRFARSLRLGTVHEMKSIHFAGAGCPPILPISIA
jgi:hypothetical protein